MTVDDDNSIYVGGLPYNATEDSIRRVFNLYGSVVAVKIINDRDIGGKCYGFVTFTNPRSAIDAISDMNGRTIDGRVVRVNEVRTRRGRTNFNRGHTHRDNDRDMDWDRDRERDRDFDHDRERYHDRNSNRSQDHDRDREEDYERSHDHDRTRDHFLNQDEDWKQEHDEKEWNRNRDHDWVRDSDIDWGRGRDDRISDYDRKDRDKDEPSKSRIGSHLIDRGTRELSSNSSDDYYDQVKEHVEISIQKREELQKEISQIEKALEDKQQLVSDLQKKSLKLEDALAAAKKIASQRGMQLTKFHRCIQQVKDYSERLKSSELELQSLVDVVMVEAGDAEDVDRDGMLYSNGKA